MAKSISSVKMVASLISNQVSASASRRGFAVASQGVVEASKMNVMIQKPSEKEQVPWIPDPVTGYYRPENRNEIDVAELREMILKQSKNKKN